MDSLPEKTKFKRLIVVINEDLANNSQLAQAIHWMGTNDNCSILYLVLVKRLENMLTVSRNMTTMKAITAGNRLDVSVNQVLSEDWLETLQKVVGPDDIIVCQEEETVLNGRFKPEALGDFLSEKFNYPVRTLAGYYHPVQAVAKKWLRELIGLFGVLVILGVFSWLQITVDNALPDPYDSIYIIFTFIIEMVAIIIWHKFAFR